MPEPIETLLAVFSLAATGWLAIGLFLSRMWKSHPGRAHGALVAALACTLVTPALFITVGLANWGLLPGKVKPQVIFSDESAGAVAIPTQTSQEGQQTPPNRPAGIGAGKSLSHFVTTSYPPTESPDLIDANLEIRPDPMDSSLRVILWKGLLFWGWVLLSTVMALRLAIDFHAGCQLARNRHQEWTGQFDQDLALLARWMDCDRVPDLLACEPISSPVLWAWSRPPRILIPGRASVAAVSEGVYLHELAHLARRDHLSALLGELVLCLLPWHPLAWWTRQTLAARAEEACDDWVIAFGCDPLNYAEELVRLAPSRPGVFTMAAMSKGSALKNRVSRLIDGGLASPRLGRAWIVGLGVIAFVAVSGLALCQPRTIRAETPAESYLATAAKPFAKLAPAPPINNQWVHRILVHSKGKPVPGPKVLIEEMTVKESQVKNALIDKVLKTDEFGVTGTNHRFDPFKSRGTGYAEDDAGRIGTMHIYPAPGYLTKIELKPTAPIRGRVVHEGKPLPGVRCRLVAFRRLDLSSVQDYPFPKSQPPRRTETDEKGEFSLEGIPDGFAGLVLLDKAGFGLAKVSILAGERPTIELAREGELQLILPDEAKVAHFAQMAWQLKDLNESTEISAPLRISYARSWIDDSIQNGKMLRLGTGKFQLTAWHRGAVPFALGEPVELEILPGKTTKLALKVEPLAQISGRIIDEKTGKGIVGAQVSLESATDPEPWSSKRGSAETGIDGKFKIYCNCNEKSSLKLYYIGKDEYNEVTYYQKNGPFGIAYSIDLKKEKNIAVPDIAMVPSIRYRYAVIDDLGKPLATPFEPFLAANQHYNIGSNHPEILTGDHFSRERGAVVTPQLDPNREMAILIRRGKAVNIPEFFIPSSTPNPQAIVVSEDYAVTVRGTVVDSTGNPVKGARVKLSSKLTPLGQLETSNHGQFEFNGLWPGIQYRIVAETVRGDWFEGVVDFQATKNIDQPRDQDIGQLKISIKQIK